jgi:hypothetical protein
VQHVNLVLRLTMQSQELCSARLQLRLQSTKFFVMALQNDVFLAEESLLLGERLLQLLDLANAADK